MRSPPPTQQRWAYGKPPASQSGRFRPERIRRRNRRTISKASSREFSNPNKCHAVTFLFYQINKMQTVTYRLEAIERRVILDPTDFTRVELSKIGASAGVGRTSLSLLAT